MTVTLLLQQVATKQTTASLHWHAGCKWHTGEPHLLMLCYDTAYNLAHTVHFKHQHQQHHG
jgi:hypothetical protein